MAFEYDCVGVESCFGEEVGCCCFCCCFKIARAGRVLEWGGLYKRLERSVYVCVWAPSTSQHLLEIQTRSFGFAVDLALLYSAGMVHKRISILPLVAPG